MGYVTRISLLGLLLLFCTLCVQSEFPTVTGPQGETVYGLGPIDAFDFSPGESSIITAGSLGFFEWSLDRDSPGLIQKEVDLTQSFEDVVISSDHSTVLYRRDRNLYRKDVAANEDILLQENSRLFNYVLSPAGTSFATKNSDFSIHTSAISVWSATSCEKRVDIPSLKFQIIEVLKISPDDSTLLVTEYPWDEQSDKGVKLFSLETGELLHIFKPENEENDPRIELCGYSPDAQRIYTSDRKTRVDIWSATDYSLIKHFTVDSYITLCEYGPMHKYLYLARYDRIDVLDIERDSVVRSIPLPDVREFRVSADEEYLIARDDQGILYGVNAQAGVNEFTYNGHTTPIESTFAPFTITSDGHYFLSNQSLINMKTNESKPLFPAGVSGDIIYLSPGEELAVVMGDQDFSLWDVNSNEKIQTFTTTQHYKIRYNAQAALSPNGRYLALMGEQSDILIWEIDTGTLVKVFTEKRGYVQSKSLMFSPDGQFLLAGDPFDHGNVWNVETGTLFKKFPVYGAGVFKFSPDGASVISSSPMATYLYNFETAQIQHALISEEDHTTDLPGIVEFSPDQNLAFFRGLTNGKLWDIQAGEIVYTFENCAYSGNLFGVVGARFLENGNKIVLVCQDGTRRYWDISQFNNTDVADWGLRR